MKEIKQIAIMMVLSMMGFGCSKEDVATVKEDIQTTVGESVTPEVGNPDNTLVVRKAKLKERRRQNTEWTSENIAKHPDLYLRQAREDIKASIDVFDANLLSVRNIKNENKRRIEESKETIDRLSSFLNEAKPIFASTNIVYPVKVSGFRFDHESFLKQVRKSIKEKETNEAIIRDAEKLVLAAEARIALIEKQREKAEDAIRLIDVKIANLKAQTALVEVNGVQINVKEIVDTACAVDDGNIGDFVGMPETMQSDEDYIRDKLGL